MKLQLGQNLCHEIEHTGGRFDCQNVSTRWKHQQRDCEPSHKGICSINHRHAHIAPIHGHIVRREARDLGEGLLRGINDPRQDRLLVQPSQACTTIWRAIFPSLSSTIAEQNTLVPSGYAQLCVKARRLPRPTLLSIL
ncbi:MAG: hypothetical protein WA624_06170 [Methylocella sp.]